MSSADATSTEAEEGPGLQSIEIPESSLKNGDHKTITAVPLSKLCSKCRNIFDHWDQIPHTDLRMKWSYEGFLGSSSRKIENAAFSHHNSLLELESSAKEGCTLCAQFVKDERILEACRKRIQELPRIFPDGKFVGQVEVGLARDVPLVNNYWWLVWDIVLSRVESDGPRFYPSYISHYSTYFDFLEVYIILIPELSKLI